MKIKSVRRRKEAVVSKYINIPEEVLGINTKLEVLFYVIFFNKLPFLVSVSKRLKFTTIEYILNRLEKELAVSVNKILNFY